MEKKEDENIQILFTNESFQMMVRGRKMFYGTFYPSLPLGKLSFLIYSKKMLIYF